MRDESKTEGIDLFVKSLFLPDEQIEVDQSEPIDVTGEFLQRTRFGLPGESASLTKTEWDEEIGSGGTAGEPLEKVYSNLRQSTRKIALTEFVKRNLATGGTVADLVAHARQHDEDTARMLEEIGAELDAA